MWFRYLIISFLRFLAGFVGIVVLYRYLIPVGASVVLVTGSAWLLAFILAFVFAVWCLGGKVPEKRSMFLLFGIWLAVNVSGYALYGMLFSTKGAAAIVAPEMLVQWALEIAAIYLAVYRLKRRSVAAILGEG
ncbi:hypothetical protein KKF59_02705 [Patescibacteria group bacterium]|nr:hypothetical protein [Patescibacteria group bacterium]MBU1034391.1 hypothetical protein [Patescibacteria group bacterium]MBU1629450.1 hypothetical protein [Patescibacteria group bacterium]MBU1908018.1 hypothetical protein [Patescibacteria group bacterium]